jgi:hypothetical protein
MSTITDISKEIAAAVAGVSHDANFKDSDGNDTLQQEQATYLYLPKFGMMVFINHENSDVEIWYDPVKTDDEWLANNFKPMLEAIARRYLYGTSVRSYEGDIKPKQLSHRTEVTESRNSLKISYHPLGDTQIRVAHTKSITEEKPGARSRNIKAVFIEKDGERFRFPYNHLMGARVMGLHVESGGRPWDDLGEKILEISRRRREIMELLRWSKKLEETDHITEIKKRGKDEVFMIRRMMERAARTGDLSEIREFQLPAKDKMIEQSMVSEAVGELSDSLSKLLS